MPAFNYNGTTFYNANGRWMDANSRPVSKELIQELNQIYPQAHKAAKVQLQKPKEQKAREMLRSIRPSAKLSNYNDRNISSDKNQKPVVSVKHRKARPASYISSVELTKDQTRALAVLESGQNVFLSGEAGTGKSFVLNEFIRRNQSRNIIVCAPTGIAAINVGGSTLHRVFKVPRSLIKPDDYNDKPDSAVVKADIIIIDEISMCRFDIFRYVIRTIRKAEEIQQKKRNIEAMNNGIVPETIMPKQIIVVGDFFQLAPVITQEDREFLNNYWNLEALGEGFAFQTRLWNELAFQNVVLKEMVRQRGNDEFIENLNRIRKGDTQGIRWFNSNVGKKPIPDSIYLCATNRSADAINLKEAEVLPGEAVIYNAQISGLVQASDKMTHDELSLKVGMQVMTLINDTEEGYQNGSIGHVISLHADSVEVRLNNGREVTVKPYDWEILSYEVQEEKVEKVVLGNFHQIPLKIAYAITIHKAQGQTYASANISPNCFAAGQLYVALSRVSSIEGMSFENEIRYSALKTSKAVKEFYEGLDEVETVIPGIYK